MRVRVMPKWAEVVAKLGRMSESEDFVVVKLDGTINPVGVYVGVTPDDTVFRAQGLRLDKEKFKEWLFSVRNLRGLKRTNGVVGFARDVQGKMVYVWVGAVVKVEVANRMMAFNGDLVYGCNLEPVGV